MGKSKTRRRRARPAQRGGVMLGMRSGFRSMSGAVTGVETSGTSRWVGTIVTVLLVLAAAGLLLSRLL
jgi:hypothetical protein